MNPTFWKNKTVLITGHTGFKGSWISIILKKFGANVVGFSKDIPTNPSMYEITCVEDGMTSIIGNINDSKHIKQVFEKNKPEIVIHMAAQALVRESYKNPLETFSTNVIGTANILDAVRNSDSVKVCIIVTSDKSYRIKPDNSKYSEDDPMGGYDPYSSSKGCAELVTSSYRSSFFNPSKFQEHQISIASVRAGNVIGGGDWATDRLIPDIIRGIQNKSNIKIRNPESTRPWQFVLDPLFGYLTLAEKMWNDGQEFSQGWNFGPTQDEEKPVKWIIEYIKKHIDEKMDLEMDLEMDASTQPHEEKYLRLDCSKSISKLKWKSKMDLEKTLLLTLNWYTEFMKGNNMKYITEKQIDQFMAV
jgi:CDP-glucose 4,6-dehydratase